MKPCKITILIRTAVIILGMALVGVAMCQMPPWFRNWFVGMVIVSGTLYLLLHDLSKPAPKSKQDPPAANNPNPKLP